LLITSQHGPHRKHRSSIVSFVPVAVGTCLLSHCPETALVYPLISRSLHSTGFTHHNINIKFHYIYNKFRSLNRVRRVAAVFLWLYLNHCPSQNTADVKWNGIMDTCLAKFKEFEVLTAVVRMSPIFWDIIPCSPLKANQRFRGKCRLHLQGQRIIFLWNVKRDKQILHFKLLSKPLWLLAYDHRIPNILILRMI
jgi:hypothetical protein